MVSVLDRLRFRRGLAVILGYYNHPSRTAQTLANQLVLIRLQYGTYYNPSCDYVSINLELSLPPDRSLPPRNVSKCKYQSEINYLLKQSLTCHEEKKSVVQRSSSRNSQFPSMRRSNTGAKSGALLACLRLNESRLHRYVNHVIW